MAKDNLLDHNYDGIRELDNDLPPWWLNLFYITIIWGVGYFLYFHVFNFGDSSAIEYQKEMNPGMVIDKGSSLFQGYNSPWADETIELTPKLRKQLENYIGPNVPFSLLIAEAKRKASVEDLAILNASFSGEEFDFSATQIPEALKEEVKTYNPLEDDTSIAQGKEIWLKNCTSCHGVFGEGGIGPNMTDQYWMHGGSFNNIMNTIIHGVPTKGMIAWSSTLRPDDILKVGSYILTIQGTNPPNPKAPQGELYQP
ncbi:MAG: cbb3-type cytochrome c oxidase N-terminal domain-containing protein [Fidelibacterota bacterium]